MAVGAPNSPAAGNAPNSPMVDDAPNSSTTVNAPNLSTAEIIPISPIAPSPLSRDIRRKPLSSFQFNNLPPSQTSQFHDTTSTNDNVSNNRPYSAVVGREDNDVALDDDDDDDDDDNEEATSGSMAAAKSSKPSSCLPQPLAMWKTETISLTIALVAFISTIILLRVYQDKDLDEWKVPLSINAIVAILTAILKGSIALPIADGISQLKWVWFTSETRNLVDMDTYDRASRGAWGAVLFLTKFLSKFKLSPLAAFGALLTLLTLLIDPFSQASVFVDNCTHKTPIPDLIPLTTQYSISGGRLGPALQWLDSGMEIAVNVGLVQPPVNSSDSIKSFVGCPTGNCTVSVAETGIFSTLTMCHKCLDVSNDIQRHDWTVIQGVGEYAAPAVYDNYTYEYGNASDPGNYVFHKLIVQNNKTLPWRDNSTEDVPGVPLPFNMTAASPYGAGNKFRSGTSAGRQWHEKDDNWNTAIASIQGIALIPNTQPCDTSFVECPSHVLAFDCALQPCIKAFNASISNGVYREDEIDRWYLHAGHDGNGFEVALNKTYINGTLRDCTPSDLQSPSHPIGVSDGAEYEFDKTYVYYPAECYHHMSQLSIYAMAQYIVPLVQEARIWEDHAVAGETWLKQFWNKGDVDMDRVEALLNGLALSMGAQMRKRSGRQGYLNGRIYNDTTHVPGYALALRPCIRVRWQFLSFPATLLVAELAFFVALVVSNWRSPWTGEWKSSCLPLILHGDSVDATDEKGLREAAGHFQGRLIQEHDDDGRWRLSTLGVRQRNSVP